MIYSGKIPEDWTPEDLMKIEEGESQSFQISLHRAILKSSSTNTRALRINIQDYRETLRMLKEHEINIHQSWQNSAPELAEILGVQAVVKARIEKARYMSDLASYGIEVASHLLNLVTNYYLSPLLPFGHVSNEVDAEYSLIDGLDGSILWSTSFRQAADWREPAHEIIDRISQKAAKRFPYRK